MFAISTDSVAFCCITAKTCLGTSSRRKVLYCWSHFGTLPTGTNLHKHRNTALYFILQLQTNGSVVKKKNSSFFVSFLRPTLNLKFVLFTFPLIPSLHFNPIHILYTKYLSTGNKWLKRNYLRFKQTPFQLNPLKHAHLLVHNNPVAVDRDQPLVCCYSTPLFHSITSFISIVIALVAVVGW